MISRFLFLVACIALVAGCQTTHQFAQYGPGWHTWRGQLHYSNPRRSLIGDVLVIKHGDADFQLEYTAGPGLALITLQQDARAEKAKGPLSFGPPGHLRGWFSLRAKFANLSPTARMLSMDSPKTKERFDFRFAQ